MKTKKGISGNVRKSQCVTHLGQEIDRQSERKKREKETLEIGLIIKHLRKLNLCFDYIVQDESKLVSRRKRAEVIPIK